MRATYTVEDVFGTRSRVRVLRVLASVDVPLNAAQIAKRTGLSKPAVGTALDELVSMGVVARASAGSARVHWLQSGNVYVERLVRPAFSLMSQLPDILVAELRDVFAESSESVVLFGSHSRGEQDRHSDIDVVLVGRDEAAKDLLEGLVADSLIGFRSRFGASLSAIVYTVDEAATLWHRAPGLQESLERDGLVVWGTRPREWRDDDQED